MTVRVKALMLDIEKSDYTGIEKLTVEMPVFLSASTHSAKIGHVIETKLTEDNKIWYKAELDFEEDFENKELAPRLVVEGDTIQEIESLFLTSVPTEDVPGIKSVEV